ncbi:DUF4291 family protein [Hahella sp. KA22]|uniref:DUF4291 domain-containing protein n=1 Tax=Hahella sp. KA22 TaxID=1628392 RepID=UPI000FDEB825|nr:DUF4291 domain-containing protein [Hahella sp. KA22]AZZ91108.1 DUF4291 domain-containing protein [Hahella sp. KA22]QAY54477.1 DUF4291 family protein [Hahella sp. KA22]
MKIKDIKTTPYLEQTSLWPASGRHILAHQDQDTLIVYQAYRPEIGEYAIKNGRFGGAYSYSRMSWIKPNFLWMMYRCGWGLKEGQEVVLGLRIRRQFFEDTLSQAVPSSYNPEEFPTQEAWKEAVQNSNVRLQWDPDHAPDGAKCERRAIQLGLRGDMLARYGKEEILEVIDFREFIAEQRAHAAPERYAELMTPQEQVFIPSDAEVSARLRLDSPD